MTVTLTPELEQAIMRAARGRGLSAEAVVLETLQEKFLPVPQSMAAEDALGEWEQMMQAAATQIAAVSDGEQAGLAALEKERV